MTETAEALECDQCLTTLEPIEHVIALTNAEPGEDGTAYEEKRVCRHCFLQVKIAMFELFKENLDQRLAILDERLQAVQIEG